MKIGVVGTGDVGRALARGYAAHGHEVRIGTRTPAGPIAGITTGTQADVAGWADLAVLAVNGGIAAELAGSLAGQLAGKPVIDTTNPVAWADGHPVFTVGTDDSLAEQLQRAAPEAGVVKAYNAVGNGLMVDPQVAGGPPTMFICGDDPRAKAQVTALLEQTGWDVADLGGIIAARAIEPMCLVWIHYGMASGAWGHAVKLLR